MDLLGISEAKFFTFLLILLRIGSLFTFAPVFGIAVIPLRVKAAAALALAVSLSVLNVGGTAPVPPGLSGLIAAVVQEIVVGLLLGLVARLFFAAIEFGGQLVGLQMGLGIVSMLDPEFETQVSVLSQVQLILATLLFLAIGGERMLIEAFAGNLEKIRPGGPIVAAPAFRALVTFAGEIFSAGLQISAPVVVSLLATQIILGVMARSVPQMNMLILGFPLQIFFGLAILALSLPAWARAVLAAFARMFEALSGFSSLLR
ncbi:MAG: flagellar biosynthetic protein FliR [Deltaproteobacteria bacterium]|nr:flagellar biosynthetic protein FliR [Deltaproteobacteria bacterium]